MRTTKHRPGDTPHAELTTRRKHLALSVAAVLVVVCLLGASRPILQAVGNFLVIQDALRPVDVIHVISGPDDRTDYAIQLYKAGLAQQIFFTGGWCTIHGYYHGRHGVELAEAQGIAPEHIAVDESHVTSTYDEIVLMKEFVGRSPTPIRSVIVVSDAFHGRRAVWTYHLVLGEEVTVLFAPVPWEESPYRLRWWEDEASREYVGQEYIKLIYYFARHRLGIKPLSDWLASLDKG